MGWLGFNFNLMDQLVFYGSYHQKPGNKLIHFLFVPLIMWSSGILLAYSGPLFNLDLPRQLSTFLPSIIAEGFPVNLGFVVSSLYATYYMLLEPFAGLTWTVLLGFPLCWSLNTLQQNVPYAWAIALVVHVFGWVMQIQVGHAMIEHKRPALMDSFFQSLVLAGLFSWMEGLFFLGYRPKLQAELHERIQQATRGSGKEHSNAAKSPAEQPLIAAEAPPAK